MEFTLEFALLIGFIVFSLLVLAATVLYRISNKGDSQLLKATPDSREEAVTQTAARSDKRSMNEGVIAPEYEANNVSGTEENPAKVASESTQTVEEPQDSESYQ